MRFVFTPPGDATAGLVSLPWREPLAQWRDDPTQTTYVFDVRDREEYEVGHLAGARNAPEGALVMSPDHYIGTQNARCVLVDDDTVRATIAALWLAQMGRWIALGLWGDALPRASSGQSLCTI